MFKLLVLSAFLAVASAGVVHSAAYSSIPTAVSHQSRTDVVSKPVVAYSAPVVAAAPVAYTSPVAYTAPIVKTVAPVAYTAGAAIPTAVSHQTRTDFTSKPVIAAYTAPVVAPAYAAPVSYTAHVTNAAYAAPVSYTGLYY